MGTEKTAKFFGETVLKIKPQEFWSDKRNEFKGAFLCLCWSNNIDTYKTDSEAKSEFAEENFCSPENITQKHLGSKWSCYYINELQSFIWTINSRLKRMTRLAVNKTSKKLVPKLVS